MCLDKDFSKKQFDKRVQQAKKRGYIRVYKVCSINWYGNKLTGTVCGEKYKAGIWKATGVGRDAGWHAYLSYRAAKKFRHPNPIKVCYAKPQWIKRLGKYIYIGEAGIFTHLAFPDWERGKMTVKQFKQICKKYNQILNRGKTK